MISPFHEDFILRIFAYAKFRENKTVAEISKFTVFKIKVYFRVHLKPSENSAQKLNNYMY